MDDEGKVCMRIHLGLPSIHAWMASSSSSSSSGSSQWLVHSNNKQACQQSDIQRCWWKQISNAQNAVQSLVAASK